MMKALNPESWQESALESFKSVPQGEISDKLTQYFLNSNIQDANEFVNLLIDNGLISSEQFNQASEFANKGGRLIARFPEPKNQQAMWEVYGKEKGFANYEQQQIQYGRSRFTAVSKALEDMRENPAKSLESLYQQLSGNKGWRTSESSTPIAERYAMFKKNALEKVKQGRSGGIPDVTVGLTQNTSQISHTGKDGTTTNLTKFKRQVVLGAIEIAFSHTEPVDKENPNWMNQMGISEDWSELVKMTVDKNNPESVLAFKKKAAEFYWKGVQLMPTPRGNSQTMLELHNILYQFHDMQPPAPSRTAVLPDCIALCCTLDEFLKLYDSCWDF